MAQRFTKRAAGNALSDNLVIMAGFTADGQRQLPTFVDEWLGDHYPQVVASGYVLHLLIVKDGKQYFRSHARGEPVSEFALSAHIREHYGLHGPVISKELTYRDLGGGCVPLFVAGKEELPEGQEDTTPGRRMLTTVIDSSDQARFKDYLETSLERGHVQLIYNVPSLSTVVRLAMMGGTGLLEDYPRDKDIRDRVHKRNLKVASQCKGAYDGYINSYVRRVQSINADPKLATAAGLPHPELQLRKLGPPESGWEFPKPVGINDREFKDIVDLGPASALPAWRAIQSKLDEIWGIRSAGSAWVTCDFELVPALNMDTPLGKFGVSGKLKYNFEADEKGDVKLVESHQEVAVNLGFTSISLDENGKKKTKYKVKASIKDPKDPKKNVYSKEVEFDPEGTGSFGLELKGATVKISFDKGKIVSGVKAKFGGYGVEFNQDGKMGIDLPLVSFGQEGAVTEISAGIFTATADQNTRTFGVGMEVGLKDWFLKRFEEKGEEPPAWAKRLPDLKLSLGAHFQSARDSDIMRVLAKTPGLWQMRPREEFVQLGWDSLDADEQNALATLGFDKHSWDLKYLPKATTGLYADLTADQMMATLHLPIPAADPYWQDYWKELAAKAPDLGSAVVTVKDASGNPKQGATVKLLSSGPEKVRTTAANGEAVFRDISCGKYEAVTGNDAEQGSSTSSGRKPLEITRGGDAKLALTAP
ncbi:MAG: carboxypeptidase-like regulatory domain-containing protein [Myxococcales bacterium]